MIAMTQKPAAERRPATVARLVDEKRIAGEDRLRLIAEAAYYRAERRGFAPGRELEDWLAAEVEIDSLLQDDEA